MKTFKEIINEGRDAPLYHSTKPDKLISILKSNVLKVSKSSNMIPTKIVSLTRDLMFAKGWQPEACVLQLDQAKLNSNYKLIPFDFHGSIDIKSGRRKWPNAEAEESVHKDITSINKYIVKIHLPKIYNDNEIFQKMVYKDQKDYALKLLDKFKVVYY